MALHPQLTWGHVRTQKRGCYSPERISKAWKWGLGQALHRAPGSRGRTTAQRRGKRLQRKENTPLPKALGIPWPWRRLFLRGPAPFPTPRPAQHRTWSSPQPPDLLFSDPHGVRNFWEDSGFNEEAPVLHGGAPTFQLGSLLLSTLDQIEDFVKLLLVNLQNRER